MEPCEVCGNDPCTCESEAKSAAVGDIEPDVDPQLGGI